ncbi:hypothetical protein [Actinoplanes awajinensis]|uniref:Uncharacterized protein n=1 Tax=Actinoplanes awajinensis subsp. mycoplanecinus TaxID=135947 RepID=A0A117MPC6_9ACTN|nr:hypothetical protein [Actinoplanes awajinensis]KUL28447.1 hypothetical protein ADL15_32030 [Actinoplanes awajinensis subsp. mycoplanecinus]
MATITAVDSPSYDHQAAWTRLQAHRRQLAGDLIPVQASAQTIAADKAAVAAAEAELTRLGAAKSVTDTQTVSSAAVWAAAQSVAPDQPKKELPHGRVLDVTV